MAINVESSIEIYELNGKDVPAGKTPKLRVRSHWNRKEFAVLVLPSGKRLTIARADLLASLDNAGNTARWVA